MLRVFVALCLVGPLGSLVERAAAADALDADPGRVARSRASAERGKAHFDLNECDEATRDFESAYRERPVPGLLFNIAQAARCAGQHDKALRLFRLYVAGLQPGRERREIEQWIKELEAEAVLAPSAAASASPAPNGSSEPSDANQAWGAALLDGEAALARGDYQVALERFSDASRLGHGAYVLLQLATALEHLERYGEAAVDVRAYLEHFPTAPNRAELVARALDLERRAQPAQPPPVILGEVRAVAPPPRAEPRRKTGLIVAGVALGALLVGAAAVLIGVVVTAGPGFPETTLGAHPGTR